LTNDSSAQHLKSTLALAKASLTIPAKATTKTRNAIFKHLQLLPMYFGFGLLGLLFVGYSIARYVLGYDNIMERFKVGAERVQRWLLRQKYTGVRTAPKDNTANPRGSIAGDWGDFEFDDLEADDDDGDDGAGFSYRQ
jgi:hypothetical protein